MPKLHTSFVKIVASPSPSAWTQIYHAGNVFAIVSVRQTEPQAKDPEHALPSVHVLGKEIINNIEAEYFTIVDKNLQTIKEALTTACTTIPDDAEVSILVAVIIENILYVFVYGDGDVFLKRGEKAGNILHQVESKQVIAASGGIEPKDIVVMTTPQFSKAVPFAELNSSLQSPSEELEEKFTSVIDDEQHAGAACAIIIFIDPHQIQSSIIASDSHVPEAVRGEAIPKRSAQTTTNEIASPVPQLVRNDDEQENNSLNVIGEEEPLSLKDKHHLADEFEDENADDEEDTPEEKPRKKLSIKKFLFLAIALALAGILIFSILKSVRIQSQDQSELVFSSQFPTAQQNYDEGQSLLSLNKNLATSDLQKAKTTLQDLKTKLPVASPHQSQINDLLTKVNQALGTTGSGQTTTLAPADNGSTLLAAEIDARTNYVAQDNKNTYSIDTNAISTVGISTKKISSVVKNNNTWKAIGGFGTYLGNFYIADTKTNQIIKLVKSDNGYNSSNYLKDTVDVSHVISLTIDGSIWILSDDGSIKKFTRGTQDQFSMQQLQKPLTHPTRIFTTADIDNLYILDPQNTRILSIKKDGGNLVQEYDASQLKDAKDLDVDEKNKKIYVLIGGKVYSIDIK